MEKARRALDLHINAFRRIYNSIVGKLREDSCDMLDVTANIKILDEKIGSINELSQLLFDLLLSTEEDNMDLLTDEIVVDKLTCEYHRLKLQIEQTSNKDSISSCNKSSNSQNKLKLPKIEFKKFGGDLKDWLPFWGQFRRIDGDPDMEDEDKFQYLLQCTIPNSRARQLVESYPATSENYSKVIESLKTRFGRRDLLVEVYVRELIKLVLNNLNSKNKLSKFYDTIESQLRALETLEVTSDTCAAILYPLVESCLDEDLIRAWQRSTFYTDSISLKERLKKLMEFLKKEVESEDRILLALSGFENRKPKEKRREETNRNLIPMATDLINKNYLKCVFCKGPHGSTDCNEAIKWSIERRKKCLFENGCCYLCLKFGHRARRCKAKVSCLNCRNKHATIVCSKVENNKFSENAEKLSTTEQSLSNHTYPEIFLQTIVVLLIGEQKSQRVRVIFDSGSHRSYITSSLVENMGYTVIRQEQLIHSLFGGRMTETVDHDCYRIKVNSLTEDYACNFEVLSQSVICNNVASIRSGSWLFEVKKLGIEITDTEDGPIDILIGSDIMGKLLSGRKYELACGLTAVHTLLGWTLMGKVQTQENVKISNSSMVINSMLSSDVAISQLWSLDVLGIKDPKESKTLKENEELVMEHFTSTVKRREDGRYEVNMPWIADHPPLPTNYDLAEKRIHSVIKSLHNKGYYDDYSRVFDDWLVEEIIEEIPVDNSKDSGYFLPHHPVIKLSSSTTKIRPVFDASAHDRRQPSLNQCLEKGINLIELIPEMLIRFRKQKIAVIADIRKAFLQIGLNSRDREFLKFIWYDKENKIKFFQHARVVFGITSCDAIPAG